MKLWKAFGSAHSAHLTIIGKFKELSKAEMAERIVEDFVNAAWEERYPNVEAFWKAWMNRAAESVRFLGPNECDFNIGLDNPCDVRQEGETVIVSDIRGHNIGGIVKVMLLYDPIEIKITGQTGP